VCVRCNQRLPLQPAVANVANVHATTIQRKRRIIVFSSHSLATSKIYSTAHVNFAAASASVVFLQQT
jgi:hypothetical protein